MHAWLENNKTLFQSAISQRRNGIKMLYNATQNDKFKWGATLNIPPDACAHACMNVTVLVCCWFKHDFIHETISTDSNRVALGAPNK